MEVHQIALDKSVIDVFKICRSLNLTSPYHIVIFLNILPESFIHSSFLIDHMPEHRRKHISGCLVISTLNLAIKGYGFGFLSKILYKLSCFGLF